MKDSNESHPTFARMNEELDIALMGQMKEIINYEFLLNINIHTVPSCGHPPRAICPTSDEPAHDGLFLTVYSNDRTDL